MATRKKPKRIESFSAEDVTKSLNPVVTSGLKKTPAELQGLQSLFVQAVRQKNYIAIKQLLDAFDEAGAIKTKEHQTVVIFPKVFDSDHYHASLIWDGNKRRLPKDWQPKLSKIGEREKAQREAAYEADLAEMKAKLKEASIIANEAGAAMRKLPDPFEGLHAPGLTIKQLVYKTFKLDETERNLLIERQLEFGRLADLRQSATDTALNAVASLNKKWGRKFKVKLP
jgi:hypothetical protein